MARVIRVILDVYDFDPNGQSFAMHVSEQIRTAKPRQMIAIHCGAGIHEEDIEITMQVVDDAVHAAIERTLGITQTLSF